MKKFWNYFGGILKKFRNNFRKSNLRSETGILSVEFTFTTPIVDPRKFKKNFNKFLKLNKFVSQ